MLSQILSTQSLATNIPYIYYPCPTWRYNLFHCSFLTCQLNCSSADSSTAVSFLGCSSPHHFPGAAVLGFPCSLSASLIAPLSISFQVQHGFNNVPSPQLPGLCSLLLQPLSAQSLFLQDITNHLPGVLFRVSPTAYGMEDKSCHLLTSPRLALSWSCSLLA